MTISGGLGGIRAPAELTVPACFRTSKFAMSRALLTDVMDYILLNTRWALRNPDLISNLEEGGMHDIRASRPSRRSFLAGSMAIGASLALPRAAGAAGERIVYANWGGSWEKAMRRAWADPFTKETGISVVSASDNSLGRLQAMVAAGKTEWDLVEGLPELARVGAEKGLLEKLDFSIIDRTHLMTRPEFFNDYSVPEVIFGRVMIYDKRLPAVPTDWTAFWDLKKFPGKRAFYNRVESGVLEAALLADGVPAEKLYPIDIPRAFKKLDEIRNHIIWYQSVTQSEQLMRDGEATLGFLADGRALNVKAGGAPVELVPQASFLTWSVFVIPKGAPNKKEAMRFLNHVLSVKAQVAVAMEYNYGPVVPEAWKLIPKDRLDIISGGPASEGKAVFQDATWWAANVEAATEKFQQWMLG
jgi:putative spermidine/putrescine transport system substrate-binding protein